MTFAFICSGSAAIIVAFLLPYLPSLFAFTEFFSQSHRRCHCVANAVCYRGFFATNSQYLNFIVFIHLRNELFPTSQTKTSLSRYLFSHICIYCFIFRNQPSALTHHSSHITITIINIKLFVHTIPNKC